MMPLMDDRSTVTILYDMIQALAREVRESHRGLRQDMTQRFDLLDQRLRDQAMALQQTEQAAAIQNDRRHVAEIASGRRTRVNLAVLSIASAALTTVAMLVLRHWWR